MPIVTQYAGRASPARCGGYWCPHNASGAMTGVQTMWSGFGKSVNTFFVQLEERVGARSAVRMAERLGLTWHTDIDQAQATPDAGERLGRVHARRRRHDAAGDGQRLRHPRRRRQLLRGQPDPAIVDSNGRSRSRPATRSASQAVSAEVARGAVDATRCVTGLQGRRRRLRRLVHRARRRTATVGRPVGGKTGTTDDTRAAWFVGHHPGLAAAALHRRPGQSVPSRRRWATRTGDQRRRGRPVQAEVWRARRSATSPHRPPRPPRSSPPRGQALPGVRRPATPAAAVVPLDSAVGRWLGSGRRATLPDWLQVHRVTCRCTGLLTAVDRPRSADGWPPRYDGRALVAAVTGTTTARDINRASTRPRDNPPSRCADVLPAPAAGRRRRGRPGAGRRTTWSHGDRHRPVRPEPRDPGPGPHRSTTASASRWSPRWS